MKIDSILYLSSRIYSQVVAWFLLLTFIYASIFWTNTIEAPSPMQAPIAYWHLWYSSFLLILPYKWNERNKLYSLRLGMIFICSLILLYNSFENIYSFRRSIIDILLNIPMIVFAIFAPLSLILYKKKANKRLNTDRQVKAGDLRF